jgi:hypothetical protein
VKLSRQIITASLWTLGLTSIIAPPRASFARTLGDCFKEEIDESIARSTQIGQNLIQDAVRRIDEECGDWRPRKWPIGKEEQKIRTKAAVQSLSHEKGLNAQEKAAVWEKFAEKMSIWTNGDWNARRYKGTDESIIFIGKSGPALVIEPNGDFYRTEFDRNAEPPGGFTPDKEKMKKLNAD